MALSIVQHPNASAAEKLGAGAYLFFEGAAHAAVAVGTGIIAWEAIVPTLTAGGTGAAIAEGACGDGDCTNEANAAIQVTQSAAQQFPTLPESGLQLSSRMLGKLAEVSTQNPNSQEVVLGFYRNGQGYTAMAQARAATYLSMPDYLWKGFEKFPGWFWKVNEFFLQKGIDRGKVFILETSLKEALSNPTKNLYWEIDYLLRHGYIYVNEGGLEKLIPQ